MPAHQDNTPPRGYHPNVDRELHQLVRHLAARYPGITIVSAWMTTLDDGERQQDVRYQAPIDRLLEAGLLTRAMVAASQDGRRGPRTTPAGCGYSLALDGLDDRSTPGHADLYIYTGMRPRERERIGTTDAMRVLKGFTLGKRRKRAA